MNHPPRASVLGQTEMLSNDRQETGGWIVFILYCKVQSLQRIPGVNHWRGNHRPWRESPPRRSMTVPETIQRNRRGELKQLDGSGLRN